MTVKKLEATPEVLNIIRGMTFDPQPDGTYFGHLPEGQLDRNLYLQVNKFLEAAGGKWKGGKTKAHIFAGDPRPAMGGLLEAGEMAVDNEDFYPTPFAVVAAMINLASAYGRSVMTARSLLEPSAGEGHIVDGLTAIGFPKRYIDVIELNPKRRALLQDKGYNVVAEDFNTFSEKRYDCILMNPPFSNHLDVKHVQRAWSLLKPNGFLVSVMMDGATWHSDRKSLVEFREFVARHGEVHTLPEKSFKDSGTEIGTRLVFLDKPNGKTGAGNPMNVVDLSDLIKI